MPNRAASLKVAPLNEASPLKVAPPNRAAPLKVAPSKEALPLKAALWKLASAITPFTRLKSMRVAPVRSRRMLFQKRELGVSVDC